MKGDRDRSGGEEVRSPLQVIIRVALLIVVLAVLVGFFLALFLRPERVVSPETEARLPTGVPLAAAARPISVAPSSGNG
jgi:ABC-type phosphate/phosphonate transport system permease subunit